MSAKADPDLQPVPKGKPVQYLEDACAGSAPPPRRQGQGQQGFRTL